MPGRLEGLRRSPEMAMVELFLSLRYLCKFMALPKLWFVFPIAVWFLLGLVWVQLYLGMSDLYF